MNDYLYDRFLVGLAVLTVAGEFLLLIPWMMLVGLCIIVGFLLRVIGGSARW